MPIFKAKSHGTGKFKRKDLARLGKNVVFEPGTLVFHPRNIEIGSNVYIGHYVILKGHYKNKIKIGDNVFISQFCFIHGAGGVIIQDNVGIGPGVMIFGSPHDLSLDDLGPINQLPLKFGPIVIEENCDIGTGAIILGGTTIARGTQVGAGAVVTKSTRPNSIVVGIPARLLRTRKQSRKAKNDQK